MFHGTNRGREHCIHERGSKGGYACYGPRYDERLGEERRESCGDRGYVTRDRNSYSILRSFDERIEKGIESS